MQSLTRLCGCYKLSTEVQAGLEALKVVEVATATAVDEGGTLAAHIIKIVVLVVSALANANIERQTAYHWKKRCKLVGTKKESCVYSNKLYMGTLYKINIFVHIIHTNTGFIFNAICLARVFDVNIN